MTFLEHIGEGIYFDGIFDDLTGRNRHRTCVGMMGRPWLGHGLVDLAQRGLEPSGRYHRSVAARVDVADSDNPVGVVGVDAGMEIQTAWPGYLNILLEG